MRLLLIVAASICLFGPMARAAAPAGGDPHAQLQRILRQPEYEVWRLRQEGNLAPNRFEMAPGLSDWIKRPFRAIGRLLEWLFSSSHSSSIAAPDIAGALPIILKWAAILVLAIALAFAVVLAIRIMARSGTGQTPTANILSRQHVLDALQAGDALSLPADQWLDEARRQAAEQNFRAVYRALYLALLSGLHQAGKIQHSRNRTNWVYVRQYRGSDDERATFGELTDLFDRVWYGHLAPAEANDLDRVRQKVAMLTGSRGSA